MFHFTNNNDSLFKSEAFDVEKHEQMHYTKANTNRQSRLKSAQMNSSSPKKEDGLLDTARCVRPSPPQILTKQHFQKRGHHHHQSKDKSEDNAQTQVKHSNKQTNKMKNKTKLLC